MDTESSQHPSPWSSSSTPPQNPVESFLGSFVTLISNYNLRYEGILYYLNLQDSTLGLQNMIYYGTEGRKNNEFQVHPYNKVYDYIIFSGIEFKEIIVKPPTSFTGCGYCLARGTICSKSCHATKPPLPIIVSSNNRPGAKIRQKHPLISNEKLIKQQATIDSNAFSVMRSVNDGFHIASNRFAQPQVSDSNFCDPDVYQSMPYGVINQAPIKDVSSYLLDSSASELKFAATQSFFTTFLPAPISIPQKYGGFDFDAMTKNFNQYNIWDPPKDKKEEIAKPAYNIDGSSYMISRNPFEPIGRPCNPFGSIARPVKHTEVYGNYLQRRLQLQPPPSNFRGVLYRTTTIHTPC